MAKNPTTTHSQLETGDPKDQPNSTGVFLNGTRTTKRKENKGGNV